MAKAKKTVKKATKKVGSTPIKKAQKATKDAQSAADFAKTFARRKRPCTTCNHTQVRDDIRVIMELIATGESNASWGGMHTWLSEKYPDFIIGETSFRHHLKHHEPALYRRCLRAKHGDEKN